MRPKAKSVSMAVRKAAAGLLKDPEQYSSKLGAILQVYFHLGEMPQAVWGKVNESLSSADKASSQFFSPASLQRIHSEAKAAMESSDNQKKKDRELRKRLREKRAEAASKWASHIADVSLVVWNLHCVLTKKTDAVSRQNFYDVFAEVNPPSEFQEAESLCKKDLFSIYWTQVCINLGSRIQRILKYDKEQLATDVAALYPAVRAAALNMLESLLNAMQAGVGDDTTPSISSGIMGGSCLDESYMDYDRFVAAADSWTLLNSSELTEIAPVTSSISSSSTIASTEWNALRGDENNNHGLFPLEKAFLDSSLERLTSPLKYLFPEDFHTLAEDDAVAGLPVLPTLPSRYDIAKLDANMRDELSLADPREGGGELGMTVMLSNNIVHMVQLFCNAARVATSESGQEAYLHRDGSATEALLHDLKHISVMSSLATFLRNAPEKAFVVPYRPAQLPQHEEAARMCHIALRPALKEIDDLSKSLVLKPLCHALNTRLSSIISKMHHGFYLEEALQNDPSSNSFVQQYLTDLYEEMAVNHLSKLPTEYASVVAVSVATYSIFTFVSNAALIRPLGELGRLRITQDLADLELALEQFVFKGGSSSILGQLDSGRPYAELRAMRQMIFWGGFDNKEANSNDITKELIREIWLRDVRPSTILHFLMGFGPDFLESPHHHKKEKAGSYVKHNLVDLDASSLNDNEEKAWITTVSCCDVYFQRKSVDNRNKNGDTRVADVLMTLGPELLRRRRQFFV